MTKRKQAVNWVMSPSRAKKSTQTGEAVTTAKTVYTDCPNYDEKRFKPEPGFVGPLMAEWNRLRGAK